MHDLPIETFISVYSEEVFTSEQVDERGQLLGNEYHADLDLFENINNDSEEEQSGANLDDDDEGHGSSPSSTESGEWRSSVSFDNDVSSSSANACSQCQSLISCSRAAPSQRVKESRVNRCLYHRRGDRSEFHLEPNGFGRYFNHSCSLKIAVKNVFVYVSARQRHATLPMTSPGTFRRMTSIFNALGSLQRKLSDQGPNYSLFALRKRMISIEYHRFAF